MALTSVLLNRFSTIELLLFTLAFIALLIGSITDFRKREVPDWISYALVFIAVGIRLIYSVATSDWMFLVYGLLGFLVFLGIALMMFYAGQWGGGDAKLLAGLGAVIGIKFSLDSLLLSFLINLFFVGAVYGIFFSVFLAIKNSRKFAKKFRELFSDKKIIRNNRIIIILSMLMFILLLFAYFYLGIPFASSMFPPVSIIFIFYLWLFVKAVENSSFYRSVKPEKLTEGDWIVREIKVDGRYVCGPKDLGIEKKQIKRLIALKKKNRVGRILIKEGIPFVPSFLLTFIATFIFGNLAVYVIARIYFG